MRFLALLAVAIAAAGCAQPPTWEQAGRAVLHAGANVLAGVTGGKGALEAPLQTEPYRNQGGYQSAAR